MTAPRHTPGPWIHHPKVPTVTVGDYVGPNNGDQVCEMYPTQNEKANARLIASAPSLLGALEKIRDYREDLKYGSIGERQRGMMEEWIDGIIAEAIRAAKGEGR